MTICDEVQVPKIQQGPPSKLILVIEYIQINIYALLKELVSENLRTTEIRRETWGIVSTI